MRSLQREDWPVLFVDDQIKADNAEGAVLQEIIKILEEEKDCYTLIAKNYSDGLDILYSRADIACIIVDWDIEMESDRKTKYKPSEFIKEIRTINDMISVLLMTDKESIWNVPTEILEIINGYIWKIEDTPEFIAGRIQKEVDRYTERVMPRFFGSLVKYAEEYKYAWHTPGHMGGNAFLKSPAGIAFHKYFGENVLRSDLSISVPELGSLLDHEGVVGEAEKEASRVFNSDRSYFVLNGTSTANQIIWRSQVMDADLALVDRNCHKSLNYAMVITGAIPVYLVPTRNPYGTIGPIHSKEFDATSIQKKIDEHPLVKDKKSRIQMCAITNSTYDGLCYNVLGIKQKLSQRVNNIHFDEAWYAYARFHPVYKDHYGMSEHELDPAHPPIFASQSTHKLLAAFSQASMIHIRNGGKRKIIPEEFNEAYMMHGSTSPNYPMIASLDVATRMMKGTAGRKLMDDTIAEPIVFRKKMVKISHELQELDPDNKWWFNVWQPEKVRINGKNKNFEDAEVDELMGNQDCWKLKPGESWHGFRNMEKDYIMLDPIKVTISSPGINAAGELDEWGIPAGIVTRFLMNRGIVAEKTGHYSWLMLFSMGTTKGKSGTLISELFAFKKLYDRNAPLTEVFPKLVSLAPDKYAQLGLREFCDQMHNYLRENDIIETMLRCFDVIPDPVMIPREAYHQVVKGNVEYVPLSDLKGRIPAVMVVPYPPGIPIIMEGEVFNNKSGIIIDYLKKVEEYEYQFPGFESDIHGVEREKQGDKNIFKIYCVMK